MDKLEYSLGSTKFGANQVISTYEELENDRRATWDDIIKTVKETQHKENRRNIENAAKHNERLNMLKKMEEDLPDEQKELENKIMELMEIEQADELQESFNNFKNLCNTILGKKQKIIEEFSSQLHYKDQQYVDSLKRFKNDIELMIEKMRSQFRDLRNKMLDHLDKIEEKFLLDRQKLIVQYKNNIDQLLENLKSAESKGEQDLNKIENDKELEAERAAADAENKLINKVINMEKYLNYLKESTENFNYDLRILLERLDYRVQVRDEKIKENNDKIEQYKKENAKLREKIQKYNRLYYNNDKENRRENHVLKEELIKMTDSYDQLKLKYQHFEKYDNLRFKDIYDMKSKEARELALKVALAERTIRTQQLGLELTNDKYDKSDGFTLEQLQKEQDIEEEDNLEIEEDVNNVSKQNILARIPIDRVKQVFNYIIMEAEFLIDFETIQKCENLTMDEKMPYYIESLCRSLNIKSEKELNNLLAIFDKFNLNAFNHIDDEDEENTENKGLRIDPDQVIEILKLFNSEKNKLAQEHMSNVINSHKLQGEANEEVKKELMNYQSENYWIKLVKIISDKTYNVWKSLDKGLLNYHDLLFERKKLVDQTRYLLDKNTELKNLLKKYMQSDDNKALLVPPHHMIKKELISYALNDIN